MACLSKFPAGRERLIAAGATADVVPRFLPSELDGCEPTWSPMGKDWGVMMGIIWESWNHGYLMESH